MADSQPDPRSTWTIKSMSVEWRTLAVRAAADAGMTIGEWMETAIARMLEIPPPARTFPEGRTAGDGFHRSLIPASPQTPPTGDLVSLMRAVEAAWTLAHATDKPIPRYIYRILCARLAAQLGRTPPP